MPALTRPRHEAFAKERQTIIEELREDKRLVLDKKDIKALNSINKALAQMGADDHSQIDREIDLEVELDCVKTALYRHFDKDGQLLYVGVSLKVIDRTMAHRTNSPWFQQIARIDIEWHNSRSAAYYHEKKAIEREQPRYNKAYNASSQ